MKLKYRSYKGPAYSGIFRVGASLTDIIIIINGMRSDQYLGAMLTLRERSKEVPPLLSSCLRKKELSFGISERLIDTIKIAIEKFNNKKILLCETCSVNLLQEDLENIKNIILKNYKQEILIPPIHPFKDDEFSAAEKTMRFLIEKYCQDINEKRENSVNIIGPTYLGYHVQDDLDAIIEILKKLDIKINVIFPFGASTKDITKIQKATLNICLNAEISFSLLLLLEERFKQPYILFPPIGVIGTLEFIKKLCNHFDKDYTKYVDNNLLNDFEFNRFDKDNMRKKAVVFGDITHTINLAKSLIMDYGIDIVMIGTYIKKFAKSFNDLFKNSNTQILISDNYLKIQNIIKKLKPDIIFGTVNEIKVASTLGIPIIRISQPGPESKKLFVNDSLIGYKGIRNLKSKLTRLIY